MGHTHRKGVKVALHGVLVHACGTAAVVSTREPPSLDTQIQTSPACRAPWDSPKPQEWSGEGAMRHPVSHSARQTRRPATVRQDDYSHVLAMALVARLHILANIFRQVKPEFVDRPEEVGMGSGLGDAVGSAVTAPERGSALVSGKPVRRGQRRRQSSKEPMSCC